jgi:glycosyltransferase involved in cell wall biosynthesis
MISIIVPTWNRAYTLEKVLPSLFEQEGVGEIILVSDGGTDDSRAVFDATAARYPRVAAKFVRQQVRKGQAAARNEGARHAGNPFILYCDDDEYLEPGYAKTCLEILLKRGAGAVSGRRVYMFQGESPAEALARFGHGFRRRRPFDPWLLELVNAAKFEGDAVLPFTNAIILTRTEFVTRYGFDEFYGSAGSGYREESDFQMNLSVNGYDVIMTNRVHSIHLALKDVTSGGARAPSLNKLIAMVRNNNHFYDRFYDRYRRRFSVHLPRGLAKVMFAVFSVYRVYLKPLFYEPVAKLIYAIRRRQQPVSAHPLAAG